jgi:protein MpaA
VTTTAPPATTATTARTATTAAATTATTGPPAATTTTTRPDLAGLASDALQVVEIGRSVDGRPITAVERGAPGGTVVLVIGVIHGDEAAGVGVVEELATADLPPGIDLWLIESMNPDGQRAGMRHNANLVDLNRNFPYDWAPLGEPGDSQYGGSGPASEPETQAIVGLVSSIQPDLVIWYHQDLFRIAPGQSGRDAEIRARYAELTGLPLLRITGGTYTGVAATWARNTLPDGVAFIVELGPRLGRAGAARHAAAVLEVATL